MFEDVLSRVQDFLAEQFGYEVCRWQVVAACILVVIVLSIAGYMYVKDANAAGNKSVKVAKRIETPKEKEKTTAQEACVYVCGAVARPGVYKLKEESRVVDAVNACGGFAADADLNNINLAKLVTDGERIWVPRVGEQNAGGTGSSVNDGPTTPEMININTANADDLDSLPGIGKTLAENIMNYRDEHGLFQSTDQLLEVDGIGPKKFDDIKDKITL